MAVDRRTLLRSGALATLSGLAAACAPQRADVVPQKALSRSEILAAVDAELRPAAAASLASAWNDYTLSDETLAQFRQMSTQFTPVDPKPLQQAVIPGRKGAPDVRVLVANAQAGASKPGLIYLHGGGYVLGDAVSDTAIIKDTAAQLDCVVVAVDYRLAPETLWSGSLEDNYAGLKWLHDKSDILGVDRSRIAVMGYSAGGGHAALLSAAARDRGEVPLVFQSLLYPMLDDRTASTRKVAPHLGNLVWTRQSNQYGWGAFLGQAPGRGDAPAGSVPARLDDLAGLPPTFIGVGALDLFVDENIAYTGRLIGAGVPAELVVVPGAYHAFDMIAPQARITQQFNTAKFNALRRAFGQPAQL